MDYEIKGQKYINIDAVRSILRPNDPAFTNKMAEAWLKNKGIEAIEVENPRTAVYTGTNMTNPVYKTEKVWLETTVKALND